MDRHLTKGIGFTIMLLNIVQCVTQDLIPISLQVNGKENVEYVCERCVTKEKGDPFYLNWNTVNAKMVSGITQSNQEYTNVSLKLKSEAKFVKIAIFTKGVSVDNSTIWLINTAFFKESDFPICLKIAFIPIPLDVTDVRWFLTEYSSIKTCLTEEVHHECSNLLNSVLVFKASSAHTISMFIKTNETIEGLHVELLSGTCPLICENGTSICDGIINMKEYYLPFKTNKKYIFDKLVPGNYCVRIASRLECCRICSENVEITIANKVIVTMSIPFTLQNNHLFMWIGIMSAILLTLCVIAYNLKGNLFYNYRAAPDGPADNIPLTDGTEEEYKINKKSEFICIQVLLLYPKESENFQTLMDAFRNLLKPFVNKVWDPLEEDNIEYVNENWLHWLDNILIIPNLRIIVVDTKMSAKWFRNDFKPDQYPIHFLDGIFYYALTRITGDQQLCADYNRIFRIRFDLEVIDEDKINIIFVPLTCYEMPQHLPQLLCDLLGSNSVLKTENVTRNKEKEYFEQALRNFRRINTAQTE